MKSFTFRIFNSMDRIERPTRHSFGSPLKIGEGCGEARTLAYESTLAAKKSSSEKVR